MNWVIFLFYYSLTNWSLLENDESLIFRQVDDTSNFPLMSQRITLYENKTMRIFRECLKLELYSYAQSLTKARFISARILHDSCTLVNCTGGYVLIQEGTVNATCPKIRNHSRKRKISKSIELFYLFETDLRCGWIWM